MLPEISNTQFEIKLIVMIPEMRINILLQDSNDALEGRYILKISIASAPLCDFPYSDIIKRSEFVCNSFQ